MVLPFRRISTVALVAAVGATATLAPSWSTPALATNLACAWVVCLAGWCLWAIVLYPKVFSPLRGLPEPANGSWYNGQWDKISKLPSGTPLREWVNSVPNDGIIRYLGFLNQERLLITSPKALAEVLVTKNYDFEKPDMVRLALGRIVGVGLLLAEGDEHKHMRKNLMPAFAFRHVKDLYPVFWQKATEGVRAMTHQILTDAATATVDGDAHPDSSPKTTAVLEINGWASRTTLDIIGVAGLGRDFGAIADPTNELFGAYKRVFEPSRQGRTLALLSLALPAWLVDRIPVRRNEDVAAAARTIRDTCLDLIRDRKLQLARKERGEGRDAAGGGGGGAVDILSVAIESGAFDDESLVRQAMTFLAAGHETIASTLTWAVYMLCLHRDVQARLRAEIRERLPSVDDAAAASVSSLDIDRMPYLNAVCSEVLRYFASIPLTMRENIVDTTIQGVRVPKGTRIVISPSATNKDISLWGPDALKFNPERWLPDKHEGDRKMAAAAGGATSNYANLTFIHGPRSCIGMNFARAEFACLLAAWVGRFDFELRDPELLDEARLDIKSSITLRPAHGLYVRTRVVEGW